MGDFHSPTPTQPQPPRYENDFLPVPDPTESYWRSSLHELDSFRSTHELPEECDICIIGGGIAGISTLYHLWNLVTASSSSAASSSTTTTTAASTAAAAAPPSSTSTTSTPTVLVLEARQLCSGATGRNGGHLKFKPSSLAAHHAAKGAEFVRELVAFVLRTMTAVKAAADHEGIATYAQVESRRTFDAFLDEADAKQIEEEYNANLERFASSLSSSSPHGPSSSAHIMDTVQLVDSTFVKHITGLKHAKAALSSSALSLWPYKFVAALLEKTLARAGDRVNFQANTPVLSVHHVFSAEGASSTLIRTDRGVVRAKKVVFASNAYTAGLLPQYRDVIVPYKGTACHITAPPPPPNTEVVIPRLANTYNISYTRQDVDYLNPRPDGGIVVGGGKWTYKEHLPLWWNNIDDSTLLQPAAQHLAGYPQREFLGWDHTGAHMDKVWTGIMARTADGVPHVGRVPQTKGQFVMAGFNGGGMSMIFEIARGIARMVMEGIEFEETGIPRLFETTEERMKLKPSPS